MKKLMIAAALASITASSTAFAVTFCDNAAGRATVSPNAGTTNPGYIQSAFNTPCSNNVQASYDEDSSGAWVAAASYKGACMQIGHTDAGVRAKTPGCSGAISDLGTSPTSAGVKAQAETDLSEAQALGSGGGSS